MTSAVDWDEGAFWPALEAAGMLVEARVALPGCPVETPALVQWEEPDALLLGASLSRQYSIKYQAADLPGLAEGTEMIIAEQLWRVRSAPRVPLEQPSGFFLSALVTRVP